MTPNIDEDILKCLELALEHVSKKAPATEMQEFYVKINLRDIPLIWDRSLIEGTRIGFVLRTRIYEVFYRGEIDPDMIHDERFRIEYQAYIEHQKEYCEK